MTLARGRQREREAAVASSHWFKWDSVDATRCLSVPFSLSRSPLVFGSLLLHLPLPREGTAPPRSHTGACVRARVHTHTHTHSDKIHVFNKVMYFH